MSPTLANLCRGSPGSKRRQGHGSDRVPNARTEFGCRGVGGVVVQRHGIRGVGGGVCGEEDVYFAWRFRREKAHPHDCPPVDTQKHPPALPRSSSKATNHMHPTAGENPCEHPPFPFLKVLDHPSSPLSATSLSHHELSSAVEAARELLRGGLPSNFTPNL